MNHEQLIEELNTIYGPVQAGKIFRTVMPGIFADFSGMLRTSAAGVQVREEYRVDDGSAVIVMSGERRKDGSLLMEAHCHTA